LSGIEGGESPPPSLPKKGARWKRKKTLPLFQRSRKKGEQARGGDKDPPGWREKRKQQAVGGTHLLNKNHEQGVPPQSGKGVEGTSPSALRRRGQKEIPFFFFRLLYDPCVNRISKCKGNFFITKPAWVFIPPSPPLILYHTASEDQARCGISPFKYEQERRRGRSRKKRRKRERESDFVVVRRDRG